MELATLFDAAAEAVRSVPRGQLLLGAMVAMFLGLVGSLLLGRLPALGRLLRFASTLSLAAILVLVVLQLSRIDPRFVLAVPELARSEQVVVGSETRVPLAADGHYWIKASIDGREAWFLVDTGATLTAISSDTAQLAGLEPRPGGPPVRMQTANGPVAAQLAEIGEMRFGNVVARDLDAIIAPGLGDTNVIGMNLLSRLASVRIEGGELILVPRHPQPVPASGQARD